MSDIDLYEKKLKEQEEIFLKAIDNVKSWYPIKVFTETNLPANMARKTCENIKNEYLRLKEEEINDI